MGNLKEEIRNLKGDNQFLNVNFQISTMKKTTR